MKEVYICSRYAGEVEKNIEEAKRFSQYCFKKGDLPVCVHIFLNEVTGMKEENGDRKKLLKVGRDYLRMTKEVWVLDVSGISEGMKLEIKMAKKMEMKIRYFKKIEKGGYRELHRSPNN